MRKINLIPLTYLSLVVMYQVMGCSNASFEGDSREPQLARKVAQAAGSNPGVQTGDDPTKPASQVHDGAVPSSLDASAGHLVSGEDPSDDPRGKIERWIPPILQPKEPPAVTSDGPHMDGMPPSPTPAEPPTPVDVTPPAMPPVAEPPMPTPMPEPAPTPAPAPIPDPAPVPAPAPDPAPVPPTTPPQVVLKPCSELYRVPATANPYFAGVSDGSSLLYRITQYDPPTPVDYSPTNSPVLVATVGECLIPGKAIYFSVAGNITFSRVDPPTDANGNINQIVRHQRGAQFGKSDIVAPINSLIGVFVGEGDPTGQLAPAPLDFSTQAARDYVSLNPALGQVFFIGTGKTTAGDLRKVIVPQGAARLYFAVMDIYQWNNNSGELSGAVMVE